ncbi:MAG: hypothetical protein ACXAEU_13715 [Candidatus Hodarchaeales archaeon]
MGEIHDIFVSWQFLLIGGIVFVIFGFFNGIGSWEGLGAHLWRIKSKPVRQCLRCLEAIKVLFLPLIGFGLGWIPQIPRPEALQGEDVSQLSVALLYAVAGMCSMMIVKFVKKTLQARGIDVNLDLKPKDQKKFR